MDEAERQRALVEELGSIAAELGWLIAIPASEDNMTTGIIIGTQDFLVDILGDNIESYDVMSIDETGLDPKEGLH
jgi:hypothetical protein